MQLKLLRKKAFNIINILIFLSLIIVCEVSFGFAGTVTIRGLSYGQSSNNLSDNPPGDIPILEDVVFNKVVFIYFEGFNPGISFGFSVFDGPSGSVNCGSSLGSGYGGGSTWNNGYSYSNADLKYIGQVIGINSAPNANSTLTSGIKTICTWVKDGGVALGPIKSEITLDRDIPAPPNEDTFFKGNITGTSKSGITVQWAKNDLNQTLKTDDKISGYEVWTKVEREGLLYITNHGKKAGAGVFTATVDTFEKTKGNPLSAAKFKTGDNVTFCIAAIGKTGVPSYADTANVSNTTAECSDFTTFSKSIKVDYSIPSPPTINVLNANYKKVGNDAFGNDIYEYFTNYSTGVDPDVINEIQFDCSKGNLVFSPTGIAKYEIQVAKDADSTNFPFYTYKYQVDSSDAATPCGFKDKDLDMKRREISIYSRSKYSVRIRAITQAEVDDQSVVDVLKSSGNLEVTDVVPRGTWFYNYADSADSISGHISIRHYEKSAATLSIATTPKYTNPNPVRYVPSGVMEFSWTNIFSNVYRGDYSYTITYEDKEFFSGKISFTNISPVALKTADLLPAGMVFGEKTKVGISVFPVDFAGNAIGSASLQVVVDTKQPYIKDNILVGSNSEGQDFIEITYSEKINESEAVILENYKIGNGANNNGALIIERIIPIKAGKEYRVFFANLMVADDEYFIQVDVNRDLPEELIKDVSGNIVKSKPIYFSGYNPLRSNISLKLFSNDNPLEWLTFVSSSSQTVYALIEKTGNGNDEIIKCMIRQDNKVPLPEDFNNIAYPIDNISVNSKSLKGQYVVQSTERTLFLYAYCLADNGRVSNRVIKEVTVDYAAPKIESIAVEDGSLVIAFNEPVVGSGDLGAFIQSNLMTQTPYFDVIGIEKLGNIGNYFRLPLVAGRTIPSERYTFTLKGIKDLNGNLVNGARQYEFYGYDANAAKISRFTVKSTNAFGVDDLGYTSTRTVSVDFDSDCTGYECRFFVYSGTRKLKPEYMDVKDNTNIVPEIIFPLDEPDATKTITLLIAKVDSNLQKITSIATKTASIVLDMAGTRNMTDVYDEGRYSRSKNVSFSWAVPAVNDVGVSGVSGYSVEIWGGNCGEPGRLISTATKVDTEFYVHKTAEDKEIFARVWPLKKTGETLPLVYDKSKGAKCSDGIIVDTKSPIMGYVSSIGTNIIEIEFLEEVQNAGNAANYKIFVFGEALEIVGVSNPDINNIKKFHIETRSTLDVLGDDMSYALIPSPGITDLAYNEFDARDTTFKGYSPTRPSIKNVRYKTAISNEDYTNSKQIEILLIDPNTDKADAISTMWMIKETYDSASPTFPDKGDFITFANKFEKYFNTTVFPGVQNNSSVKYPLQTDSDSKVYLYFYVIDDHSEVSGVHMRRDFYYDATSPSVFQVFPAEGEKNVDPLETIQVLFTEDIKEYQKTTSGMFATQAANGSETISVTDENGNVVPGTSSISGNVVYFTPDKLDYKTKYYVKVNTSLSDMASNQLSYAYESTFETKSSKSAMQPVDEPTHLMSDGGGGGGCFIGNFSVDNGKSKYLWFLGFSVLFLNTLVLSGGKKEK